MKYFFVMPNESDHWETYRSININSAYFSKDSFFHYLKLSDSILNLKLTISNDNDKNNYLNLLANNKWYEGFYYHRNEWNFKKALDLYNQALSIYDQTNEVHNRAMTLNSIAWLSENIGDIHSAINYYNKSLELNEIQNNKQGIMITIESLSNLYIVFDDLARAEEYSTRSANIANELKNFVHMPYCLINLAHIRTKQNKFKEADSLLSLSMKISIDSSNIHAQGLTYRGMAINLEENKLFNQALVLHFKCLELSQSVKNLKGVVQSYYSIGEIYSKLGNNDKAIKNAAKGLGIAQKIGLIKYVYEISHFLSNIYSANGTYMEAYEMFNLSVQMKDSLFNLSNQKEVERRAMKYEFDKKEAIQKLELTQQKTQKNLYLGTGALLLLLVSGLINRLVVIRKTKKVIEFQKQKLEDSEKFKTRLYTNITHEFRTPLTLILGMTEQIKMHPDKFLNSGLQLIQRNGNSLLFLINQLLDLAKIESNRLKINYVQTNAVAYIHQICQSFIAMAEASDIKLNVTSVEKEILMDIDKVKMNQILSNLLSNAFKFTEPGGEIQIQISRITDRDTGNIDNLSIIVSDTGKGIGEKDLEHIFDRFYQVDSSPTRKHEGTGIGLSLVKELINLLNGTIEVQSQLQVRTTFKIKLPISNNAPIDENSFVNNSEIIHSPVSSTLAVNNLASNKESLPLLLIVEDNLDILQFLEQSMEHEYCIIKAVNGEIGINIALETIPDIIISDVMMPEKDGFELVEILKQDIRTSHIPIVLLTARALMEDRISGLKKGADAYIAKPFHFEELSTQIQNLLLSRQRLQEYYSKLTATEQLTKSAKETEHAFLLNIRQKIENSMAEARDLSIEELSNELFMSRMQLHRKIKALTDKSTSLYIRSIRLQRARTLLKEKKLTVSEIAYAVGFEDPKYFSRVFLEEFGNAPSHMS